MRSRPATARSILAVGNDDQWRRLCRALDLSSLAADARFSTNDGRVRTYGVLRPQLADIFTSRTVTSLVLTLRAAGVPCGEVRSVGEALADPQAAARDMIETVAHATIGPLQVLGVPVKLSATPGSVRRAPPRLGEDTRAVLVNDLRMTMDDVNALEAEGAIASAPGA